jgi:hypothetical protein
MGAVVSPLEIPYLQDVAKTVLFRYSHEGEPMTRYGKAASKSVRRAMRRRKQGTLRSGPQKRDQGSEANMSRLIESNVHGGRSPKPEEPTPQPPQPELPPKHPADPKLPEPDPDPPTPPLPLPGNPEPATI